MSVRVGDKCEMNGSRSVWYIREITPSGYAKIAKQFRDGHIIEMGNVYHVSAFRPYGSKQAWRDKNGRTAEEAVKVFRVGETVIYTILGDFWAKITDIRNGQITAECPAGSGELRAFKPRLGYDGHWGWWDGNYPLRKDDGHFHEYDD